jgi:ubiquinone/menaquinone biosynthesis C-methylase UbiE
MSSKYSFQKYIYPSRWMDYWYQIREVLTLHPRNLLEVGVGSGVVFDYLKSQGVNITTIDINKELNPDVVGSVTNIPLKDNFFDVVLCAEVLEHLPFADFEKGLKELNRVSKKYVVLSLPHFGPMIKASIKAPFIKEIKIFFKTYLPVVHKFNGEHYWEIGKKGYPSSKIRKIINKHFEIKKEFIPHESHYHRFYVLEK